MQSCSVFFFFFFKQKTAYEMCGRDWSSDVCSSDLLQEQEYLQNCVARICKYKPDVLLVEQTVSRVAQQLLLNAGITVISNLKQVP